MNEICRWVEFHGATKCFLRLGIIGFLAINLVDSMPVEVGGRFSGQMKSALEDE